MVWFSSAGLSLLTDAAGGPNHGWPASPQLLVAGNGYWPSIAVRDGHVYIAYLGHNGHLHSLSDASGAWLDVVVVGHAVHEPSIAVDSTGRARIAFTDSSDRPVTGIEVAQDKGTATHPSFVVTHVPGTSAPQLDWTDPSDGSPRIAIDRHDRTHLAWEHVTHDKDIDTSHVYVASFGKGHWTPPSQRNLGSGSVGALALDATGRAVVVTPDISLVRETAAGGVRTVLYEPAHRWYPAVAVALSPTGRVVVAFSDRAHHRPCLYLMRQR